MLKYSIEKFFDIFITFAFSLCLINSYITKKRGKHPVNIEKAGYYHMQKDLDELICWILDEMSRDNVPDETQKQRIRSRVFGADEGENRENIFKGE